MALPDISNLSTEDLRELIVAAQALYTQGEANKTADIAARKAAIEEAIVELLTLLGPEDSAPGTDTINGILKFTDAQMAGAAGLAFRRIFQGMKMLTETTLDIANVVRNR